MSKKALAYLDGGPADGRTLELEQPEWAPIAILRLEVNGEDVVYHRVKQHHPQPGEPWRYVHEAAYRDRVDEDGQGANEDPYDD